MKMTKRLLALALCAAMLFGMLPVQNAEALVVNESGKIYFSTFEDLQELAGQTYSSTARACYNGPSPLVISEDITTPQKLWVDFGEAEVIVPAGVTFTYLDSGIGLYVDTLTVEGTAVVGTLYLKKALKIYGAMELSGNFMVNEAQELVGLEKLTLTGANPQVYTRYEANRFAQILSSLTSGNNYTFDVEGAEMVLSGSVEVPANVATMNLLGQMTVPVGAKLTLNGGKVTLGTTFSVQGTLENNSVLSLSNSGAKLDVSESGVYTGTGVLEAKTEANLTSRVSGLDFADFEISSASNGYYHATLKETDDAPVPDEWGNYTFTTMEELKQLASMTFERWTWANYAGSETFVIDESITLPMNLPLGSNGAAIEIAEGVVVDVHEGHFDKLVVNGTLNIQALQLYTQLDVNGVLNIGNSAYYNWDADVDCADGEINYAENAQMGLYCSSSDVSLRDICLRATQDPSIRYIYNLEQEETFTEDLTIPETVFLRIYAPVTVAEGVTLTFEAEAVYMMAPVTVYGTLQNNNWANITYPSATLTIAEGGTYSAEGCLVIHGITDGDPMVAIPGLDTTGYVLSNEGWQDGTTWQLVPEGYNPGGEGGGNGSNDGLTFSTFEELKELASQNLDPWTSIFYIGEGPLVIDETIVCPEYLMIHASEYEVRIGENGNLTVQDLYADKLVVEGTLNVATVGMQTSLNVTGTMSVKDGMRVQEDTELNGLENVCFQHEYTYIFCDYTQVDKARMLELVEQAKQSTDQRWLYVLNTREEIVLDQDLTVPSNVQWYLDKPVTVAAGTTLTVYCYNVICNEPMTIEGTLENNSWIMVSTYNNAAMVFGEGSTYTGSGTIAVEKDPSVSLEEVLPGLDLSSLYVRQDGDWWTYISTTDNSGGGNGGLTFSSFEELKELAAQSWDNWTWVTYAGEGDLEITEDITIPENLNIQMNNKTLRIAEGVNARLNNLSCSWLEVEGDLYVRHANVSMQLTVTGSLSVEQSVYIAGQANLEGRDKISFTNEWGGIYREYYNVGLERLEELIAEAEANAQVDPRMHSSIYLNAENMVLEKSLTVPSMVNLQIEQSLTVAAGATLSLNSDNAQLYAPVTVYGTLENNSGLYVGGFSGATLTIGEGGTYSGRGTITVEKDPSVSLEEVLPGLDLSEKEIRQDGDWWWNIYPGKPKFSSFEELKELAKENYDVYTEVKYTGEGPLVISEDITTPQNMYIMAENADVVIEEGVTADLGQMYVNNLEVKGTVSAVYIFMNGNLTVTGKLNIRRGIGISQISNVTGYQNIVFAESWITLTRVFYVTNQDELRTALSAAENPTWPRENTEINVRSDLTLTENMTVPKDTNVYAYANVTVAENAVLTVNGYWLQGYNMTVEGTLVNNTNFAVQGWGDGHLTIAEGGKYEGRGYLRIFGDKEDPMVLLSGLNADDFTISSSNGAWILFYTAGLTPVAAPSDLTWGYAYIDGEKVAMPGAASWKSGLTDSVRKECVWFYRINEDGTEERVNQYGEMSYNAKDTVEGYYSFEQMLLEDLPSGRYYFTVYSAGDYETTSDSETVKSEIWEYTKPDAKLNACTDVGWSEDSFKATWTNTNSDEDVYAYIVNWYYKAQADSEEYHLGWIPAQGDDYCEIDDYTLLQIGTGYYSFTVHPVSADITKACNGPVSERSEWYHLEKMPETPTVQLGNLLLDNTKTDEEKLEEVQQMGAETLKTVIEENANALSIVSQLEEYMAGGTAEVEISDEVVEEIEELVVEEISIIGANLNSKENEAEEIKLVIDKVEEVREITGNYETSNAVQFSMTLENVKDSKNLEVPVVVTLPVPDGLDPAKVVILHYHDDGTYDVITPEVSIVGGKTYAQFVLTSFSDFAILEKLAALLGDIDKTDDVNVDDVLALLWYVLFPDEYPIGDTAADFDGSGDVNVDDVLALLWHVLFPEEYPL